MTEPDMKQFEYNHLPEWMQGASAMFCVAAEAVYTGMEPGPERASCLRLTLMAKDAAVRALKDSLRAYDIGDEGTISIYVGTSLEEAQGIREAAAVAEGSTLDPSWRVHKLTMREAKQTPFMVDTNGERMTVAEAIADRGGWNRGPRWIGAYARA